MIVQVEEWRDIPGYPNYRASNLGQVWSKPRATTRGGVRKTQTDRNGYQQLTLTQSGRRVTVRVHQLVALAFLGPRLEGHEVRHRNGTPADNRVVNLEWGTSSENKHDKVRHGRHHHAIRTHCNFGHEFSQENTHIRTDGSRQCRECARRRARDAYRNKQKARSTG